MQLRIVIPMPPGLLALNKKSERHAYVRDGVTRRTIGTRSEWAAAFDEAVLHIRQARALQGWGTREDYEVDIAVVAHWPHDKGDHDAVAKAVSDALQAAGVYENDSQVREGRYRRVWGSSEPRIEVMVEDVG